MKFMVYLCLIAVAALSVLSFYQFNSITSARTGGRLATCSAFQTLDDNFVKLIRDGEAQAPTLTYYKTHPADLAIVIKGDEAAVVLIRSGRPAYCAVTK